MFLRLTLLPLLITLFLGLPFNPPDNSIQPAITSGSIYWGASLYGKPPDTANFQPGGLYYNFERNVARKGLSIIAWGAPWEYPAGNMLSFQTTYFENVRLHGSIPMLHWGSWSCCAVLQPRYTLANVARGDFDSFVRQWATDAKAWGYPFFLRFNWEMNGNWQFPWSVQLNGNTPAQYISAWRHVHDIFTQVGATNATWVWCPNISSTKTTPMSQVYPGDGYVDWICLDGYNQFTHGNMPWLSFTQVIRGDTNVVSNSKNSYQEITSLAPSKPLMIGETGSLEYGDGGTKKGDWMRQMLADIPVNFPRVKALVYFNWNDNSSSLSWPVESTSPSSSGFSAGIQASRYLTNTFTNMPKLSKVNASSSAVVRTDTIGVYKSGVFYLRNSNTGGNADIAATFGGDLSDLPVVGDWNGDGIDTIGVYRTSTGVFYLSDSNTSPSVSYSIVMGNPNDTPFAGHWTSSMTHDGVGVFRPSTGILYQKSNLTSGVSDFFAIFGNPGDSAFAGDWDGDGLDSIGIYRSSSKQWYLSNNSQPLGVIFSNISFGWDIGTNLPLVGDWDGDSFETAAAYTAANGTFSLNNTNGATNNVIQFTFGPTGGKPISGKWAANSGSPSGLEQVLVNPGVQSAAPQPIDNISSEGAD